MPWCAQCGVEATESQRFCGNCGASLLPGKGPTRSAKKKYRVALVVSILVFFAIVVIVASINSGGGSGSADSTQGTVTSPSAVSEGSGPLASANANTDLAKPSPSSTGQNANARTATSASMPTASPVGIGKTMNVGYWSYSVNGYTWAPYILESGEIQRPNAEFLVIEVRAQNNDNSASTLPPIQLVDASGDTFSSSTILDDRYLDPLMTLNPHVSTEGLVAFDVPQGQYRVKLSGGYESSSTVLVNLAGPSASSSSQTAAPSTPSDSPPSPTDSSVPPNE